MSNAAAKKILEQAEADLRRLIQDALARGRYGDVAAIAHMADGLAQLLGPTGLDEVIGGAADDTDTDTDEPPDAEAGRFPRPGSKSSKRAIRRSFPRFEREGDRLVKIAWSKREREEYEHKAPREIVDLLIDYIKGRKGAGARFVAPDVLPMKNPKTKREVPSYQAYLALAWLCHEGVVVKHGRNGYSLKPTAAAPEHLSQLWEALPARD